LLTSQAGEVPAPVPVHKFPVVLVGHVQVDVWIFYVLLPKERAPMGYASRKHWVHDVRYQALVIVKRARLLLPLWIVVVVAVSNLWVQNNMVQTAVVRIVDQILFDAWIYVFGGRSISAVNFV